MSAARSLRPGVPCVRRFKSSGIAVRQPVSGSADIRGTDTDYRQNEALAQRTWTEAHADYWRHYRLTHPE